MKEIPFLSVSGSHFECGKKIGETFKDLIFKYRDLCKNDPPENMTWEDCLNQTKYFIDPTQKYFPQMVEEIKGAAQGSGMDFTEIFALTIEEWYSSSYQPKACTDIITLPPASAHTLIAHNNDLPPSFYDCLTAVEWNFDDGTSMFTVGLAGFMASVGVNNSKIVLSGNAVSPTDTRSGGIPRALIARAILLATNFDDAVKIAIHPERASSYNNIITTLNQSVSVEGSATSFDYIFPIKGILTHSNHYCSPKMLNFEAKPNYTSSIERLNSAKRLPSNTTSQIDFQTIKSFLLDHGAENIPSDNTVCRHGDASATLFGFAVDLDEGIVELASGFPCQNPFKKVWQLK